MSCKKDIPEINIYKRFINTITNSYEFKKRHDKFEKNPSLKNYNKLIIFLRYQNIKFDRISKNSTSLLTDNTGSVIFNSNLKDDIDNLGISNRNSFSNFNQGKIIFNNIYQNKASSMANKMGTSQVNFYQKNQNYITFYISKKVGSAYTIGFQIKHYPSKNDTYECEPGFHLAENERDCVKDN